VPPGQEKDFLNDRPVQELSGIAKNRQRSLAALGALTFGHVAKLPSMLLKQKFGIWGQQLWLFSNGQWNEPLVLEIKDRTTISSSTTLPQDEHDYEAALTFMLSESTRLTGQLRREKMQAREFSVAVRFTNFTEVGTSHRFKHPQFLNSVINEVMEQMFRGIMAGQRLPVRQIRIAPVIYHDRHQPAMKLMRWGLIPSWAKDESVGNAISMRGRKRCPAGMRFARRSSTGAA
jgi:nucleotidyltransferase/DNA polymerase involved in DNA repair